MRIAVVGGGPGGLYFSALVKQLDPTHEVTVWERNAPDDTFGFGVVFSDETLGGIEHADPVVFARDAAALRPLGRHRRPLPRDDDDVRRARVRGDEPQGAAGASCSAGAPNSASPCRFRTEAPDPERLRARVRPGPRRRRRTLAGAHRVRRRVPARRFETRRSKYMWLGTDLVFEAFKFYVEETPHGVMQIHGYPYDRTGSTFIVEMHDDVWQRAFGDVATLDLPPGESDTKSIALDRAAVRRRARRAPGVRQQLQVAELPVAAQRDLAARQPRADRRRRAHRALLHRLGHEAGHGGRAGPGRLPARARRPRRRRWPPTRRSGGRSCSPPSARRRPASSGSRTSGTTCTRTPSSSRSTSSPAAAGSPTRTCGCATPSSSPASTSGSPGPSRCRPSRGRRCSTRSGSGELELKNRIVVSAMDMYSADDGLPTDFHLVHLGSKALGGAALVMTEMVCTSPEGRITPGCAGLCTPEQEAAWARVVDFVHSATDARIGAQLGHSGRKGSTKLMWEGIDEPLPRGQLGGRRALRAARTPPANQVPARAGRGRARRHPRRVRAQRARPRPGRASTSWSCTARTATC